MFFFGWGQVNEMTSKTYTCQYLSPNLILVTWHTYPTEDDERHFLSEHRQQLGTAQEPLYYISDLRQGRIITVATLVRMSELTQHPNYGGGTAFSSDPISKIMVSSFRRMSLDATTKTAMFESLEEALGFLESLKAGITDGIDWNAVVSGPG